MLGTHLSDEPNKVINLTRKQHKFLCLERATIVEWQGASEDQKFVAKPTQSNMTLFFANGIKDCFNDRKQFLTKKPTKYLADY